MVWAIDVVPTGCHAHSVGLGFFWSDGADMVCIGDSASIGYLGFIDEFYCSRPFNFLTVGS